MKKQEIVSVVMMASLLSDAHGFCPGHSFQHQKSLRNLNDPWAPNRSTPFQMPTLINPARRVSSSSSSLRAYNNDKNSNFLMDQFKTADGEIIDPYRILRVGRKADKNEIRQSYRMLSKKYHPDGARFRDIFPGKCNNLEEVRDEWERIKLAYEILSDKKLRLKYDRHSALNDPAAALGRAALDTLGWGATSLMKGIMVLGEMAANSAKDSYNIVSDETESNVRESTTVIQGTCPKYTGEQNEFGIIQNSALILAIPAHAVYYEQIDDGTFKRDIVSEATQLTLDALTWGMISMAEVVVQVGEVLVKHARQELDKKIVEWKLQKDPWKYSNI